LWYNYDVRNEIYVIRRKKQVKAINVMSGLSTSQAMKSRVGIYEKRTWRQVEYELDYACNSIFFYFLLAKYMQTTQVCTKIDDVGNAYLF
jgi:hypothetical protein